MTPNLLGDLFAPALSALLRANLAAGLLILLVFVLRKPVRRQFGARVAYGLWLLPLLGAAASLLPARTAAPVITAAPPSAPVQAVAVPETLQAGTATAAHAASEAVTSAAVALPFDMAGLTAALWLAGAVFSLTWLVLRQMQFSADMRRGRAGPAVVGFLRPRVVLPDDFGQRYDAREQAVVLTHETTHLARQDARIVALAALLRCLNWFNPLVHLAVFHLRMDQELACDAQVVQADPAVRRAYAETMLKAQMAARPLPLGCYWPSASAHPLTERITLLTAKGPSRMRALAGAGMVVVLGLSCGVAAWAAKPASAPAVILTPAGLSGQDAADAQLAAHYARTRNLPLTFAPVETGRLLRNLRDNGILDGELNATGATVVNLPGGKVSVDGVVREGAVANIEIQDGKPVYLAGPVGQVDASLPAVARGKAIEVDATVVAPDGKTIRNHRTVSFDRNGSRGPYNNQGSAYFLGVIPSQVGDKVQVRVVLRKDNALVAEGMTTLASGADGEVVLSNGSKVTLHAAVRDYAAGEDDRTPMRREFRAWSATVGAEIARAQAERAADLAKRDARTRQRERDRALAEHDAAMARHDAAMANHDAVMAAGDRAREAARKADLADRIANEAAAQARAAAAAPATSDLARQTQVLLEATQTFNAAQRDFRNDPSPENDRRREEARQALAKAREAQQVTVGQVQKLAMAAAKAGMEAGRAGREAAARGRSGIEIPPLPQMDRFDPEAFGAAMGKWGEEFGKQFEGFKRFESYGKPRPAPTPVPAPTPAPDLN